MSVSVVKASIIMFEMNKPVLKEFAAPETVQTA